MLQNYDDVTIEGKYISQYSSGRCHMLEFGMRLKYLWLLLLLPLNSEVHASQTCAATISELRMMLGDQNFPLMWAETTMTDGKPLVMSIFEKNGSLLLEFIKTKEGL